MRVTPSDSRDFAYSLAGVRAGRGGVVRVRLAGGGEATRRVRAGGVVRGPIVGVYATGTTASGLTAVPGPAAGAVPYATAFDGPGPSPP